MVVVSKSTARGLRSAAVALFSVALVLPAGSATWAAIGDQAGQTAPSANVDEVAARLAAATSRAEIVAILVGSNLTKAQAQDAIERAKSSFEQKARDLEASNQAAGGAAYQAFRDARNAQGKAKFNLKEATRLVQSLERRIARARAGDGSDSEIRALSKQLKTAKKEMAKAETALKVADRRLRKAGMASGNSGDQGELAQLTDLAGYLGGLADQVSASSGESDTQVAFVNNGAGQNEDGTPRGSGDATGSIAQPNNNLASNNAVTIYVS